VKTASRAFVLLLGVGIAVGQEPAKDWIPAVTFPNAAMSASLHPTEESFLNGTFSEFGAKGVRKFSATLRNGQVKMEYKPLGSVEVELTGFHDVSEGGAVFGIVEYHRTSIGGSSSNDCFVQVVRFKEGLKPLLIQQIQFGCDSPGSGSMVSADGRGLTIKQGYKWDSDLGVVGFKWAGSKLSVTGRSTEPVTRSQ
jgi:hypothetical protein